MKIRIKNLATLLLLSLIAFVTSCARDYEDDINGAQKDMDALVQKDQELRQYLTQSISEARQRLNQMLDTEDATLQGEISSKMGELKGDITTRMENIKSEMLTKFTQSEQRAQQKLEALDGLLNGTGGVKDRLQNKLNQVEQAVLNAQSGHNQQLASALELYEGKLQSLQTTLGNLEQTVASLRSELDALANVNYQNRLNNVENQLAELEQFNLDQKLEELAHSLHIFTEDNYAQMTTSDLDILNGFYADLVTYSNNVLGAYSDFDDDLTQYEQTLATLQADLEIVAGELEGIDTDFSNMNDVLAEDQNLDDIDDKINEIEGYESQIQQIIGDLESCKDDCDNALADATEIESQDYNDQSFVSIAETWETMLEDRQDEFSDWVEHLQSTYPWWDW